VVAVPFVVAVAVAVVALIVAASLLTSPGYCLMQNG